MDNYEKFITGLRMAFEAAKDLDGVENIYWHIRYTGHGGSQEYVAKAVQNLMKEMGMCG